MHGSKQDSYGIECADGAVRAAGGGNSIKEPEQEGWPKTRVRVQCHAMLIAFLQRL